MGNQDKVAFICEECAGSKNLATKASWTAHMKSFHPKVLQVQADLEKTTTNNHTSNTTLSAPSSNSTPAPTTSAPTTPAPTTPAVRNLAAAAASDAPAPVAPTPVDVAALPLPYDDEEELASDSEVMDMWAEVQECIEKVTTTETEPEKEQENKDELDDKVKRLQTIILRKNDMMKSLKSDKENLKHEVKMMKEVIVDKDKLVDEKEAVIKYCENEKIKQEQNLDELRESYNNILKEKSNLEIEVNTKDFVIKALKKVSETQEKGDVEVVEVSPGTSRVEMDKNNSGSFCNFCDKGFRNNRDLERHIEAKHENTEQSAGYECTLCGDGFSIEKDLSNHVLKCIRSFAIVQCPSCKDNFAKGAMKKHKQKGKCVPKNNEIRNHSSENHRDGERSRIVCRHWKQGQCFRGDSCMFAHVGFQDQTAAKKNTTRLTSETPSPDTSMRPCRNGTSCVWLANHRCHYFHQEQPRHGGQMRVQQRQGYQQQVEQQRQGVRQVQVGHQGGWQSMSNKDCWYQESCRRSQCPFNHKSNMDFPNLLQNKGRIYQ